MHFGFNGTSGSALGLPGYTLSTTECSTPLTEQAERIRRRHILKTVFLGTAFKFGTNFEGLQ